MRPCSLCQYFIFFQLSFWAYLTLKVGSRSLDHTFKVTGTSRSLESNHLVRHLSVVRFQTLVHSIECRQDATHCVPEGSAYKTMFSPTFCLMDENSTYFPFNELLCRYKPIQMKITSRTCGVKENGGLHIYLETKDKGSMDSGANNSINIWHRKNPP